jgi:uncharacterized membrane protein
MMALYFQNRFSDTVWIAFLYNNPGCGANGGVPWRKLGWWRVDPGQTFNAWNTDLRTVNRYVAWYAEEFRDGGGATWSGTGNNWYSIPDVGFNQCYSDESHCNQQPDFNALDFAGNSDVLVVLGPRAGQRQEQEWIPLPDQLDFDWNPITFGNGVAVGGSSHLTVRKDGTYTFSGHFHDSGALEYNMSLAWAVKDSNNQAYTFETQGHVAGTFESGSRDYNWNTDGQNDAISTNWAAIATANTASATAAANVDLTNLVNSLIGTLGTVLGIVAIVVA